MKHREQNYDLSRLDAPQKDFPFVTDPVSSLSIYSGVNNLSASIIIPARNASETIELCLSAISYSSIARHFPQQLQVIVVDDGSTDKTWDIVSSLSYQFELIIVQQNARGRAQAMNLGISYADRDIVVSCDADMIVAPFTFNEMLRRHNCYKNLLLFGFRADVELNQIKDSGIQNFIFQQNIDYRMDERFSFDIIHPESPGWPKSPCVDTRHAQDLHRYSKIWMPDNDAYAAPDLVYGALFSVSRDFLLAIGGFEENFVGWGYEDTYLAAKFFAGGASIIPVYSAFGWHIKHPPRSKNKALEANTNKKLYKQLIRKPPQGASLPLSDAELKKRSKKIIFKKNLHLSLCLNSQDLNIDKYLQWHIKHGWTSQNNWIYWAELGEYDHAISLSSDISSTLRGNDLLCLSKCNLKLGNYHAAKNLLSKAVLDVETSSAALIEMALLAMVNSQFSEALSLYNSAINCPILSDDCKYGLLYSSEFLGLRAKMHFKNGFVSVALRDSSVAFFKSPKNGEIIDICRKLVSIIGENGF